MPFAIPTPVQIRDRLATDLEVALPGADARSRRTVEGVLARMATFASYDLYAYQGWIANQIFVTTADDDTLTNLHAPLWGITPKPPALAGGPVTVGGNVGVTLPAGAQMMRSDGWLYSLNADVTVGSTGTGAGAATAATPGADGNCAVGTRLNLTSPVAGINTLVTVANDGSGNGLSGGADLETADALRARVLARIQSPPQGGAQSDYIAWTLQVPGVTRAWCFPGWLGPGTVGITFMRDNDVSPLPSATEVDAVSAWIQPLRPVTAAVSVFAPAPDTIPFTIALNPNTVAVQSAVQAAIADFFTREATPGGTIYLSRLNAEISAALGDFAQQLVTPAADIISAPGHIAMPGAITWNSYP